jgi:rubrerythrin
MSKKDVRILESAVRMELDGRKFYLKAAKTAKNLIARKLLESLAEQELAHIDRIKEISEGLKHEEDWAYFAGTINSQAKKKLALVFKPLTAAEKKKLKADPSNV